MPPSILWNTGSVQSAISPNDWACVGPKVLDILVECSRCDCAILRKEGDATHLILEGYKARMEAEVPDRKLLRFWNGDAFSTCFVQNYPDGSLAALTEDEVQSYTSLEREFLESVHWRGTFPVSPHDEGQRLAIVVSYDEKRPDWASDEQMSLAWLASQLTASMDHSGSLEQENGFICALRHLPAISGKNANLEKWGLPTLLRILTSGRGLGWQRCLIMQRDHLGEFSCIDCAGGLTAKDWGPAAKFAATDLRSMLDEISHEIVDQPRRNDALCKLCIGPENLTLDGDAGHALEEVTSSSKNRFKIPTEMDFDLSGLWHNRILELAKSKSVDFEQSERNFVCPFTIGSEQFVAVLGWSDTRTGHSPKLIESGVIITVASQLMASAQAKLNVSEELSTYAEDLSAIISWCGTEPIKGKQLEIAKLRRSRLMYELSEEYRSQIGEKLLRAQGARYKDHEDSLDQP